MRKCGMCSTEKPDEEFAWKNKSKGTRQSHCRDCHKQYRKTHYENNRQKYVKKAADRKKEIKKKHFQWLATQQCEDCGISDIRVLEFDHVRGEKLGEVSQMLGNVSAAVLQAEIAKCEIVCANCHRIRTADRAGFYDYSPV